jgi:molybdopterin/thiamine biosynthesis adenylyltransferase
MDDRQLLRYSRQILLPQIGIEGQQKLLASRVLIIGMGGLGSPVAMYLAASGVGHLTLVDHDTVELTNLQRQIVHTTQTLGTPKVESAQNMLAALNPEVHIDTVNHKLDAAELAGAVRGADVVVDASDNFATRFAVNRACVAEKRPLVSGAAVRLEGQVSVFRPDLPEGPCYACLYRDTSAEEGDLCSQFGVLAPVVGIIGSIQATETIKVLLGLGEMLAGRLLLLDATTMEWRTIKVRKDPACLVCGAAG